MEWDQESRCVCPSCGFVGLPQRGLFRNVVFRMKSFRKTLSGHSLTNRQCPACNKSQLIPLKPPFGKTLDLLFGESPGLGHFSS